MKVGHHSSLHVHSTCCFPPFARAPPLTVIALPSKLDLILRLSKFDHRNLRLPFYYRGFVCESKINKLPLVMGQWMCFMMVWYYASHARGGTTGRGTCRTCWTRRPNLPEYLYPSFLDHRNVPFPLFYRVHFPYYWYNQAALVVLVVGLSNGDRVMLLIQRGPHSVLIIKTFVSHCCSLFRLYSVTQRSLPCSPIQMSIWCSVQWVDATCAVRLQMLHNVRYVHYMNIDLEIAQVFVTIIGVSPSPILIVSLLKKHEDRRPFGPWAILIKSLHVQSGSCRKRYYLCHALCIGTMRTRSLSATLSRNFDLEYPLWNNRMMCLNSQEAHQGIARPSPVLILLLSYHEDLFVGSKLNETLFKRYIYSLLSSRGIYAPCLMAMIDCWVSLRQSCTEV